jgi:S-formylglutathione hydrolase
VNATEAKWASNYKMYDYVTNELPALINSTFKTTGPKP